MDFRIDFNSDEAIYLQLRNQIVIGIASGKLSEGENLPSVRQLAEDIGINMHTVNKAYSVLRQEGFVKVDRRRGAVVSVDCDKTAALSELMDKLAVDLAGAICRKVGVQEAHKLVDEIYQAYGKQGQ